jgi:ubiquinone/menaquinone biosynthesis C-methylase UbiE
VYGIWILEHIKDPSLSLQEAFRVLKSGGKIMLNETDLMTLLIYPDCPDYHYLQQALWDLLAKNGNPYIARRLGTLLKKIGFEKVTITPWVFHFLAQELQEFIDYIDEWLSPTLSQMVNQLGRDPVRL